MKVYYKGNKEMENTVFHLRKLGREMLKGNNDYNTGALETDLIISYFLDIDRVYLELSPNVVVSDDNIKKIVIAFKKRKNSYPVAYILGEKEFMSYTFSVREGVLIPRDDTGTVIEATLENIPNKEKEMNALEIGTGTGIISIMLLANLKNLNMSACDINKKALDLSYKNAKYIKEQSGIEIDSRLRLIESNLFDKLDKNFKFDFIISNPPYIETDTINELDEDVRYFEPKEALDGGLDGLDFYRKILSQGYDFLVDGGFFAFEIGYNQYEKISNLM